MGLPHVRWPARFRTPRVGASGRSSNRGARDAGQALAEAALALPVLLLLVFGIIEFGSAWRSYQVITNAAREGARRAVMPQGAGLVNTSESAVLAIVEDVMTPGGLSFEASYVSFSCGGTSGLCSGSSSRGTPEEVRIEYPYEFAVLGPLMELVSGSGDGPGTVTLTTSSVMRSEG